MTRPLTTAMAPMLTASWLHSQMARPQAPTISRPFSAVQHQLHGRLHAQRGLPLAHLLLQRGACVGVLALGVGEQLDGEDVGVGVDDAPDQHGAGLRRLRRALLDARHEDDEHDDVGRQPDDQRDQQPRIGGREDDGRADPLHAGVPDGVDHLHDRVAQRGRCLHHLVGDAAGEVVLEEAQALAQHVAVRQPAHAGRHRPGDDLVLDQVVRGRDHRPGDHGNERHPQQHACRAR